MDGTLEIGDRRQDGGRPADQGLAPKVAWTQNQSLNCCPPIGSTR
jgi:hypothetical protein